MDKDKAPAIRFFLSASVLMALSTFLWFGLCYFVDEKQHPSLFEMESGVYVIAAITGFFALFSVIKGIQQQKK
ncbi:MAG: hypothetical protein ABJN04_10230 [Hyphomicrobiales bacterium]